MSFRELLDTWEQSARVTQTRSTYAVHLPMESAARIAGLCEMFPGRTREEIITGLHTESLEALAAEMRYVPGSTVIREDDHGDPVYEDLGHAPRYIELTRKHRKTVGG